MNKDLVILEKNLVWCKVEKQLKFDNKIIKMAKSQTDILNILIKNRGTPVSSEQLFYEVFEDKDYSVQSIRTLICKIRKKIPYDIIKNIYGSRYMICNNESRKNIFDQYLYQILDQAKNGIVLSDPNQEDNPVIYVNQAFTDVFGYTAQEVLGKNCRFLQNDDKDQKGIPLIREAIKKEESITVILRNYTKNKDLIYNEVTISPIFDENGKLKFFLGIQKDITKEQKLLRQFKEIFQ